MVWLPGPPCLAGLWAVSLVVVMGAAAAAPPPLPSDWTSYLILHDCDENSLWSAKKQAFLDTGSAFEGVYCLVTQQKEADVVKSIAETAADLSQTLIITSLIDESNAELYMDLLDKGTVVFWIDGEPAAVMEKNYDRRSYSFVADDTAGGDWIAWEFCRRTSEVGAQDIVIIRAPNTTKLNHVQGRSDGFIQGLKEYCPQVPHNIVADVVGDWSEALAEEIMEYWFISNPKVTAVIAANDAMAIGAYTAAVHVRARGGSNLYISGYDNSEEVQGLLENGAVFMTVDSQSTYSDGGQVFSVMVAAQEILTEASDSFQLPKVIMHPVIPRMPDQGRFILQSLVLPNYDYQTKPLGQTEVLVGLRRLAITDIDPVSGTAGAVFYLRSQWKDSRLQYDDNWYNASITIKPLANDPVIWTPSLYFLNQETALVKIADTQISVDPDGTVHHYMNLALDFLMFDTDISTYPFDVHNITMLLRVYAPNDDVHLRPDFGFEIVEGPADFELEEVEGWENSTLVDAEGVAIDYFIVATRHSYAFYLRLIVPAVLLNLIGFLTFWLDNPADGLGLGITTLLCTLALKETVDLPPTAFLTWVELFMLFNIAYQGVALFLGFSEFHQEWQEAAVCLVLSVLDLMRCRRWMSPAERAEKRRHYRANNKYQGNQVLPANTSDHPFSPLHEEQDSKPQAEDSAEATVAPTEAKKKQQQEEEEDKRIFKGLTPADWVGRCIVVPSYVIFFCLLVFGDKGWFV